MVLAHVAGPLIGAVIGYCTNYIAVKMLFYPRKEVRLFGRKLPFTPGAIPKGKGRLARAIGVIVGEQLLTKQDLLDQLGSEDVLETVEDQIMSLTDSTVKELAGEFLGRDEAYADVETVISNMLTGEIMDSVNHIGLGEIIVREGSRVIKEKTAGTMLAMFLSDELIDSITVPVSEEIEKYILENGETLVSAEVQKKLSGFSENTVDELLQSVSLDKEKAREQIHVLLQRAFKYGAEQMFEKVNVSGLVEEKINTMDIVEVEKLVLTVMKNELDTIVNLGALIGLILGTLNLFLA